MAQPARRAQAETRVGDSATVVRAYPPKPAEDALAATALLFMFAALASAPAVASPNAPAVATPCGPESPTVAVRCLATAYSRKSLADLGGLLAADYRFHMSSMRDSLVAHFVEGFVRDHEIESASALFNGMVREGLVVMPAAESISVTVEGVSESADPEHRDSTAHYRVVAVRQLQMRILLASGARVVTSPSLHVFHLVRGDAAVRVEGQPADSGRWYLRRWLEDVDALALALAGGEGRCGEPAPKPVAPARGEAGDAAPGRGMVVPTALAIHPLGNPGCSTLDLMCDLPGSEPARVEVFDVTGRLVNRRLLPASGPGTVKVEAGVGASLRPGVYWVRLSQSARKPSTRMVVVAR